MFPSLIDLGLVDLPWVGETHLFLPTYGVLFALAVLAAWWWFMRRARALGPPEEQLFNLTFYSLLAGILGAKLLLIVVDWRYYLSHPGEILGTLRSAGVLAGGLVGAALTFTLYARRKGLPLFELADAIVAPLALAQAVGRLGCFAAGCCWGVSAQPHNPLAVTFTDPQASQQTGVPLNVALVPVQLIQMAHDVGLALLLTLLWRLRLRPPGTVFWIYVLLYSVGRGTIEFWRGDSHRGLLLGGILSTSQLFAIVGIVLALSMLVRARLRSRRAERPASA